MTEILKSVMDVIIFVRRNRAGIVNQQHAQQLQLIACRKYVVMASYLRVRSAMTVIQTTETAAPVCVNMSLTNHKSSLNAIKHGFKFLMSTVLRSREQIAEYVQRLLVRILPRILHKLW